MFLWCKNIAKPGLSPDTQSTNFLGDLTAEEYNILMTYVLKRYLWFKSTCQSFNVFFLRKGEISFNDFTNLYLFEHMVFHFNLRNTVHK